jgi:hypothetical protein
MAVRARLVRQLKSSDAIWDEHRIGLKPVTRRVWAPIGKRPIEVVEIAPIFLEAMCRRQRRSVVAKVVLAELAGGVAEIMQELGERRSAGPQIGWAARQLRRDHARAKRIHAGEEGVAAGGATLHGDIVHEDRALLADFAGSVHVMLLVQPWQTLQ